MLAYSRYMVKILAIETSCDETALALVEGTGERVVLHASVVRSQVDIHAAYGGVVPDIAAREHIELLMPMMHKAKADGLLEGLDAIAVTAGPGLAPALRVGVGAAKGLAWSLGLPLVPVCHLEGHIYASWLQKDHKVPQFPLLALIVSGGHTEIVLMKGHGQFERLGETLDDAAGEAFDKVAKMMDLGYPGGPKVDALAKTGNKEAYAFPRPMEKSGDLLMSFSGIKTSVLYTLRALTDAQALTEQVKADIAASFEEAVIDILIKKTMTAVAQVQPASVVLAGGVAANANLRVRLASACAQVNVPFFLSELQYSMDNAAMIAVAGYFRFLQGAAVDPAQVFPDPNLDIV